MAQLNFSPWMDAYNSVLCSPDTELKEIVLEALELIRFDADICMHFEVCLDRAAKGAKKDRMTAATALADATSCLPGIPGWTAEDAGALSVEDLELSQGRPRGIDGEIALILGVVRAHFGSMSSKEAVERIRDSETLNSYFRARGRKMPSRSAINAWLNCIPEECWQLVFETHLRMVREEGLDDMSEITADSFSVWADSAWPTDSGMILGLLNRAWRCASKLPEFGLPTFLQAKIDLWLERIRTFDRQIAFACGKPGSRRRIRRLYTKLYKHAELCLARFDRQLPALLLAWHGGVASLPLFARADATMFVNRVLSDLADTAKVIAYSRKRVVRGESTPMAEKILSLADPDAAYIKKGGREPVLGYKPQLVRSSEGFITAFELQKGNPADAARLVPMVDQHIANTAVRPVVVSVDDGYSSGRNRQALLERDVEVISMNGAKGKKITPEQEWHSEPYKQARDKRSAVESLVYTFRFKFHVYRFSRRGLTGVRAEIFEKVVAHNFWRATILRKRAAARERPDRSTAA